MNVAKPNSQITALRKIVDTAPTVLAKPSEDGIAARIRSLHQAGLAFPVSVSTKNAARFYIYSLKDFSGEALRRTCVKILKGEVEAHKAFMPTPAEFAALVRVEHQIIAVEIRSARDTLEALQPKEEKQARSPEEQARISAKVREARKNLAIWKEQAKGENKDPEQQEPHFPGAETFGSRINHGKA